MLRLKRRMSEIVGVRGSWKAEAVELNFANGKGFKSEVYALRLLGKLDLLFPRQSGMQHDKK